ncbi:MAG: DUF222 domain-containing protein [Actinomycetales bacterium]|nr:DUF222 domain-containing protein [Actinomycetales bacterium]
MRARHARGACRGARVAVVAEAESRGEVAASQAGSTTGWIAGHAPSLAAAGAGQLARLVRDTHRADLAPVRDAVLAGTVSVPAGLTVCSEFAALRHRLVDEAAPTVLAGMLELAASHGSPGVRRLRPALLAAYGMDGELQKDADQAARLVALTRGLVDELGSVTYRLTLDPEGAAVLEAAIGPLSAPTPDPRGGRDLRDPALRRGEALIEVCRRVAAAAAVAEATDRPIGAPKATLLLTMHHDDLAQRLGAATVLGSAASGTLVAPETARKLACDAQVIPAVLGRTGEILDLGRASRLASAAQLTTLWFRDRGCTFPGCDVPAHWCDAHHASTGSTAAGPTSATSPCCADDITRSPIETACMHPSRPLRSCGT